MKFVRERCEKLNLNQLIEEYSLVEKDMNEARHNRDKAEKNLNDFMRLAHGQNVEVQPKFIKLKEEKLRNVEECREFDEALKYVRDKLQTKFNYKIGQSTRVVQPLQNKRQLKQTARMRTTPAPPRKNNANPEIPEKDESRTLFDTKDSDLWCKECDTHYQTIKEYCEHLHKREHMSQCSKPAQPPWRTTVEQLNRKKSYDYYKSICAKLSNKLRQPFSVQDLDEIMNPALKGQSDKLKQMTLKRERSEFATDDPLFTYKGYDMLIPINGYYCKLCDKTLCDREEAEKHLRSYNHNSEYAKSVALNPVHEKVFRQNLEKSYKEQFGSDLRRVSDEHSPSKKRDPDKAKSSSTKTSETSAPSQAQSSDLKASSSSSSSNSAPSLASTSGDRRSTTPTIATAAKGVSVPLQWSARLPYKKPTSKIVDEHEVIADKFEKRDTVRSSEASKSKAKTSSDRSFSISGLLLNNKGKETYQQEKSKLDRRREPEIVPLNVNQPSAALKRLRTDGSKKQDEATKQQEETAKQQNEATKQSEQNSAIQQQVHEHADDNIMDCVNTVVADLNSSEDEDKNVTHRQAKPKRAQSKAIVDDDDDDETDSEEHVVESHAPNEFQLERGDKESPFPDLCLSTSKNVHHDALKDPRLAAPLKVKLNRVDMNEYKGMLLDEANLWSRVDFMMTKKEPTEFRKELNLATATEPSYFKPNGESVPIHFDSSDDESPFEMNMLENFFCENK